VRWLQSFADERCGLFGTVYQAAGFRFYGEHLSTFWELDGEVYHNIIMTSVNGRQTADARRLIANAGRAIRRELRQFRYLKFLQPRFEKACVLKPLPFPKPDYAARLVDEPEPSGASEA